MIRTLCYMVVICMWQPVGIRCLRCAVVKRGQVRNDMLDGLKGGAALAGDLV